MTVDVQVPYTELQGNGVSTSFGYPFLLPSAAWLRVYLNQVLQTGGYSVTGLNNPAGGQVLFTTPPALGAIILLTRISPLNQLVDLQPYDAFPAQTVEDALNKMTIIAQQVQAALIGRVGIPETELPGQQVMQLPSAGDRANQVVGFDALGNVVLYPPGGGGGGGVTAHNALTGLTLGNDHPQYLLALDAIQQYLTITGGTLTGPLILAANPTQAAGAATKSYVDQFTGSVIAKNITSNVTGDAQPTVHQAWNAQANAQLITRAANEIIYYRWPSTLNNVYRYLGSQTGPSGWTSVALDWPSSAGIADAPVDGVAYARKDAGWTPATLALSTGATTPATLTADTNNYAPAGFATASELRLSTDASRNLTGITGGTIGRLIFVHNVGAFNLVLKDEDAASTAANRFALPADLTLLPDTAAIFQYDNTSLRWRLLGGSGSGGGVKQQDTEPTMVKGELWFDSDSGSFSLRYQNPDLTFTNVGLNGSGGDFIASSARGVANGVASLDAGAKVPAAQLLISSVKVLALTRAANGATANVPYTGLGFKPKAVVLVQGRSNVDGSWSIGLDDLITPVCLFTNSAHTFQGLKTSGPASSILFEEGSGNYQSGRMLSFDADGFTIAWTLTGSLSANVHSVYALCIG